MRSLKKLSLERETKKKKKKFNLQSTHVLIYSYALCCNRFSCFLRIADVLINLLIRDLRIVDGIEKATGIDLEKTTQPMLKLTKSFSMTHARFDFSGT